MLLDANSKSFSNGVHGFVRGQSMHILAYMPTLYNKTPFSIEDGFGETIPVC